MNKDVVAKIPHIILRVSSDTIIIWNNKYYEIRNIILLNCYISLWQRTSGNNIIIIKPIKILLFKYYKERTKMA